MKSLFSDKTFNRKLMSLVLPVALQQLMVSVVSASDAITLGLIEQDKMSAVSLATQISFVESLFLAAMTIGLSLLLAQYWGKKDTDAMERIFGYVMKITAAVSFLFFITALCFPETLMKLFTNEKILIDGGTEYLRTVSPSYLLTGISQVLLCVLKNSGHTKKAGIISSACMVGDMIMNIVLIPGLFGLPRLEIIGAAISTVIARAVEVVWCYASLNRHSVVKLRLTDMLRNDRLLCRDFWKYTAPVLGNEIVWGVGFTMYSVIMGHLGTDAVAANSIAGIVKNLAACFCIGLAGGGGIMIGNELGAGNLDAAKNYGKRITLFSVFIGIASGAVLLIFTPLILYAVNLTDTSAEYLKNMLIICSYYMIGKSVNSVTISGIFCAGGDSRFGFICDAITMWGIIVPLGLISAFVLKLPVPVVYFIVSLDEFVKLPMVYKNYKKYNWVRNLTRKEETIS